MDVEDTDLTTEIEALKVNLAIDPAAVAEPTFSGRPGYLPTN